MAKQVWPCLVLWMRFARLRALVDRRQAHLAHQPTDAMTPNAPAVASQMPCHLPRAELTNLRVKPRQLGVPALLARAALLVEDLGQLLDRLSLPSCNLGWMQFVLGRQLRNSWPLIASSATFALNSAENRLRVLMVDCPLHSRIHLNRLSQDHLYRPARVAKFQDRSAKLWHGDILSARQPRPTGQGSKISARRAP